MKKIWLLLGVVLILSSELSARSYSPSWWTGTNGSTAGNPNGVWQLDRFCASNVTPGTATPANFTRAFYTAGATYDTRAWSGDNDWPHAFSYAGHSNASSVDEISLIFYKTTDGIDQAGHHMSLTFVAPTAGTYSISGYVDYCGIYNGAPSTMKGLDVIIFKYAGGTWTRTDQLTLYSSSSSVLNISPSSSHYYSGNAALPNGVALNAGDYITFRPWAWDRGYFYQANMDDILVLNVASFTLPDGNWPAGAGDSDNPYSQWAVKSQASAEYTEIYTLVDNNQWTLPGDAGYYNWGPQGQAGVQSHNMLARTIAWLDGNRFGCIEFTVPDGWNGENAVITGNTSTPTTIGWNNVNIYRLNAAGTMDCELFNESMLGSDLDIDVNVPVCSGDRIIYRSSSAYSATENYLEDYQIKLVGRDIPWFDTSEGNPYVDPMHNTWAVYQTTSDDSNDWSSYDLMTWDSNGLWVGPNTSGGYPSYKSPGHRCISSVDLGGGTDYITAFTYTPCVTGDYSWTGKIKNGDPNSSSSCIVHFGKFDDSNDYILLKSVTVSGSNTVNLRSFPELQAVDVNNNERLVVFVVANTNSAAQIYFGPNDDHAGIKPLVVTEVRNVMDFGAVGDGVTDDTNAIQAAISYSPGLIYFPSGTYLVSHEIKVWGSFGGTQLIGDYSGTRPKILLAASTPGYNDVNNLAYVIRFYKSAPPDYNVAYDTAFGSALNCINIEVESGNAGAVALSHRGNLPGYVRNCEITLNGNYLGMDGLPGASVTENVKITGGQIGIKVGEGQAPSSLRGCTFLGQTVASVDVYQTGLVFTGCDFNNVAIGIRVPTNMGEYPAARLYLEDCIFRNITGNKAIVGQKNWSGIGTGDWWYWVLALKNVYFKDVNEIAYWEAGTNPVKAAVSIAGQASGWCRADYVTHGNRWANGVKVNSDGENHREVTASPSAPTYTASDFVLEIPNKSDCVSVKDYNAYGDGIHDDTAAIEAAIADTNNIFFPMGTYITSDTIQLHKDTKLIGEHSRYTTIQLVPDDNSFNDVNNPKPVIDTVNDSSGTAVFSGFDLGKYAYLEGLVNIRWRVGANSIIDGIFGLNYGSVIYGGYCPLLITGQGGGNIRHAWFPWEHDSGHGQIIIEGTNQPLYFAGVCAEHDLYKPSVYINQSQNIIFRTLCNETNCRIVDANNSNNLIFNDVLYNGDDDSGNSTAMKFTNCSNVEVYNYWRLWNAGHYYDYGINYNDSNNIVDLGNLVIAAYRWGPSLASAPNPANSATDVNITPTLSWTAGAGAASHYVYFGTDSTPDETEYQGNQTATTYVPGTLISNTTYYWRIDEVGSGGVTTGTVWSFTTVKAVPTFIVAGAVTSNTTAITPAIPAGIAANDILLLFLETANQAISITNQNGGTWTAVTNSPQGTGTAGSTTATRLTVFWSRYNGTQGAPTTSDSGDHQAGRIISIRGATTTDNPWNVTAGGIEAVSDTTGSIPGATTTVANTLVVTAIAAALPDSTSTTNFASWTNANLTSITERVDSARSAGNGGAIGIATGIRSVTGAHGNTAVTLTTSAYKGMMSIAIKP